VTTTTTAAATRDRAEAIRAIARDWHVALTTSQGGDVITAECLFPAGDATAYRTAEVACLAVLAEFRQIRPGSMWGTDSGSVGGAAGLRDGHMRLSKSGVERRLAQQFLGADPGLTLAVDRAERRRDARDERAAGIVKHALALRDALAELDADDDHLAHVGGQMVDRASELADAWRGMGGCAAELERDVACLSARIKALLAVTP
jgi:hypothetical protein